MAERDRLTYLRYGPGLGEWGQTTGAYDNPLINEYNPVAVSPNLLDKYPLGTMQDIPGLGTVTIADRSFVRQGDPTYNTVEQWVPPAGMTTIGWNVPGMGTPQNPYQLGNLPVSPLSLLPGGGGGDGGGSGGGGGYGGPGGFSGIGFGPGSYSGPGFGAGFWSLGTGTGGPGGIQPKELQSGGVVPDQGVPGVIMSEYGYPIPIPQHLRFGRYAVNEKDVAGELLRQGFQKGGSSAGYGIGYGIQQANYDPYAAQARLIASQAAGQPGYEIPIQNLGVPVSASSGGVVGERQREEYDPFYGDLLERVRLRTMPYIPGPPFDPAPVPIFDEPGQYQRYYNPYFGRGSDLRLLAQAGAVVPQLPPLPMLPSMSAGIPAAMPMMPGSPMTGGAMETVQAYQRRKPSTDTVPAMLSPGEMVLNRSQQKAVQPRPGKAHLLRADQRAAFRRARRY